MNIEIEKDVLDWEAVIRSRLRNLRFGAVQLTVHQGRVIQVEFTEKIRLKQAGEDRSPGKTRPLDNNYSKDH